MQPSKTLGFEYFTHRKRYVPSMKSRNTLKHNIYVMMSENVDDNNDNVEKETLTETGINTR